MTETTAHSKRVIIRDLVIFQLKLALDGAKDLVLSPVAIMAAGADLLFPGERPGQRFYAVLRLGERFDRWLSLFRPAHEAQADADGLFGASRAGSDTLLGHLEKMVIGHAEPR